MTNINYCDKQHWLDLWRRLGVVLDDDISFAYNDIIKRYAEPQRRYHNINHISHCLAELETVKHLAQDLNALELAIWYHDAVYEIQAKDNEERSAVLAQDVMNKFYLPIELIKKVSDIILATKHNKTPDDYDAKLMLDIDISNLGQVDKFKETNKLVREEHSLVPDNLFVGGRSNILESFLNHPSIYLTEFFQDKYEVSARENILSSIKDLRL